jgi:hypothetical protein
VIRRFEHEGRTAFGHIRNSRGTPTDLGETFHDEGMTVNAAATEIAGHPLARPG